MIAASCFATSHAREQLVPYALTIGNFQRDKEKLRRTHVTPIFKICCISRLSEARLAIQFGAYVLGLVSKMPSGPGVISESMILEITKIIPPAIASFQLTSEQNVSGIIDQRKRCRANTISLVDRLEHGTYDDLRAALPGVSLVQVFHIAGKESIDEARRIAQTSERQDKLA